VQGLVARVALDDGERARGAGVLKSDAGTLRLAVPPLAPGVERAFRFSIAVR
jgi:hypothetical protein